MEPSALQGQTQEHVKRIEVGQSSRDRDAAGGGRWIGLPRHLGHTGAAGSSGEGRSAGPLPPLSRIGKVDLDGIGLDR